MICIDFVLDNKRHIQRFEVKGHSGFDDYGKDIVCAAVSAVVQTAILGLTDVVGIKIVYILENGNAKCDVGIISDSVKREKADIVLNTLRLGLLSIQAGYSDYVTVLERKA